MALFKERASLKECIRFPIHCNTQIQHFIYVSIRWVMEVGILLLASAFLVNTVLTHPPVLNNFPYIEMLAASIVVLVSTILLVRERWFNVLTPRNRSRLVWGGVTTVVILAIPIVSLQIWANYLVSSSSSVMNAKSREYSISQSAKDATVAMEDSRFYQHCGFDLEAMHRALRTNVRAGRVKVGGSTITQQLAKNLFLSSERTVGRKIIEIPIALALESQLTKDQILTLYMRSIPYGMGLRGIGSAADTYFHTTPDQLSILQSAILVGLVPHNPKKFPAVKTIASWQATALFRIEQSFEGQYSSEITTAYKTPVGACIYPLRTVYERGAGAVIAPGWMGVLWFSYISHTAPQIIPDVSPLLKARLGYFALEARKHYSVVGIYHMGVYADRSQRKNLQLTSAHAYGQAIDIAGFRFADGSSIYIRNHDDLDTQKRLLPLIRLFHKHFDHIVDWTNEPELHQDHIHAEVLGPRPKVDRSSTLTSDAKALTSAINEKE